VFTLKVHSVLIFEGKPVGVRFKHGDAFGDVELEKLKGVSIEALKKLKAQKLIPHGDLLVTEEELKNNVIVQDFSSRPDFVEQAIRVLTAPQSSGGVGKTGAKGKKVFTVVVEAEGMYDPVSRSFKKQQFEAEIEAPNALVARKKAKEIYAQELGTSPDEITIVNCVIKQ